MRGQAAVELVALLPVLALLLAAAWQGVVAAHAVWAAGAAARTAARAAAVGGNAPRAARRALPPALRPGARIDAAEAGAVEVAVRIPTLPGIPPLGRTTAFAHFRPQR